MVTPVTGPIYDNYSSTDYYRFKMRYRQKKPVDRPLPYSHGSARAYDRYPPNWGPTASVIPLWDSFGTETDVHNRCYEKFRNKMASKADISETILERQQARDMITARLMQIAKATVELRNFKFKQAAKTLGLKKVPRGVSNFRKRSQDFGGIWLEYHLGWAPLFGSIYEALDFLQRPIPSVDIRARVTTMGIHAQSWDTGQVYRRDTTSEWRYREQLQAKIRISNPDLWLANNLGLVNPLSWIWALTTLSFVADWVVNVGDVIAASTDFVGVELIHPMTTRSGINHYLERWPGYGFTVTIDGMWMSRFEGISGPSLYIRPWKGLSWQRGLTAVSLLTQALQPRNVLRTYA